MDHFQEMFLNALELKHVQARTILFDGWYASAEKLKLIHRRQRSFFTTLKGSAIQVRLASKRQSAIR